MSLGIITRARTVDRANGIASSAGETADRGGHSEDDHAPNTNPANRKVRYSEVDATTEKLQRMFGAGHGPLSDEEIAAVVRDETEELEDAPVQAFT